MCICIWRFVCTSVVLCVVFSVYVSRLLVCMCTYVFACVHVCACVWKCCPHLAGLWVPIPSPVEVIQLHLQRVLALLQVDLPAWLLVPRYTSRSAWLFFLYMCVHVYVWLWCLCHIVWSAVLSFPLYCYLSPCYLVLQSSLWLSVPEHCVQSLNIVGHVCLAAVLHCYPWDALQVSPSDEVLHCQVHCVLILLAR